MLGGRARNFSRAAGFERTMLSMRACAGLVLSAVPLLVAAAGAHAATYCVGLSGPGCTPADSPQHALDMAKANSGFDTVMLGTATYDVGEGLAYSDDGLAENGLRIESSTSCPNRYTCNFTTLRGGGDGTAVLSLSAPGRSDVRVLGARIEPSPGAIGLALGPGARGEGVNVTAGDATGVRIDGTPSMPAFLSRSSVSAALGADVPGYGVVENSNLIGVTGVRAHAGGNIDIRGGGISAITGVVAPEGRITGTAITFADPGYFEASGSPVGVETGCADSDSPDAAIEIVNATIAARNGAGATGVLAQGRGGDGTGCDATVDISSSIVHNADVSLDARGEAGTGADQRDGSARIDVSYSNVRAAATRTTGPATIETTTPGGNVDTDPAFAAPGWLAYPLFWKSPLIDAGDPAVPEEWQRPYIDVVRGRRDIGEFEYGFNRPVVDPFAAWAKVATGKQIDLFAGARDDDYGDPLDVVWTLPDGTLSSGETLVRSFDSTGRYRFEVEVTDPTGQATQAAVTVRVLRQILTDLRVRPARFRPPRRRGTGPGTTIRFTARVADTVDFRVHRAVRRRGSSRIRWRRVPGSFDWPVFASEYSRGESVSFDGWLGRRRLRPGIYRLTARGRGEGKPATARFRIVR
jgi:hypothetical protein